MSKLTFRARTLDASKPMPIYNVEDLPELTDINFINRAVPALPSGMEKEEESEKHLQDILDAQNQMKPSDELVIPTPEVFQADLESEYDSIYKPSVFKPPKGYIHVQPFSVDQDLPDYDMDSEDERFFHDVLKGQKKFEVSELTFEDMIDRLEKNSGHNVVSAKEAKLLLKEDDELILAVYDYWVDKRLRLKQPLMPTVKSDKRDGTSGNNPYIAFRRRTEKMQTRKNRKNDEASYEKMLKLRRDLSRAVTLLEMVKRREKTKKEGLNLTADIFEKRYSCGDYEGKVINEALAHKPQKVLQPQHSYYPNRYAESWVHQLNQSSRDDQPKQKRIYRKKNKQKAVHRSAYLPSSSGGPEFGTPLGDGLSSDDDRFSASPSEAEDDEMEGPFAFRRKKNCQYLAPTDDFATPSTFPWECGDKYKFSLASLSTPKPRCVGYVRRRIGRGGRVILDRAPTEFDDLLGSMDFSIASDAGANGPPWTEDWPTHFRPVTPPHCREEDWDPYRVRLSESNIGLPTLPVKPSNTPRNRTISGVGLRTVSVDSVIAQNAATAVVTSDVLDIFGNVPSSKATTAMRT